MTGSFVQVQSSSVKILFSVNNSLFFFFFLVLLAFNVAIERIYAMLAFSFLCMPWF